MEYVNFIKEITMRNRIETFIPKAIEYFLKNKNKFSNKDGSFNKVYNGYLASFGPSVITAGLITTVAFYEGDSEKKKINEAISTLLSDEINEKIELIEFIRSDKFKNNELYYKELILDIVISLKLAYRTFELKEAK